MRDPHPLEGKILFYMNARNSPSFPCPSPPGVYHLRTPKSLFFHVEYILCRERKSTGKGCMKLLTMVTFSSVKPFPWMIKQQGK